MIGKRVLDYSEELKKLDIAHEIVEHPDLRTPEEVQGFLGLTSSDGFSTMLMKTDDSFVAVIRRDDSRLDFEKVKRAVGTRNVRMANAQEFEEITHGLPLGAAPAYNPGLNTYLDEKLFDKETLTGGSGSFLCSFRYVAKDLSKIPGSTIVDVIEKQTSSAKKRLMTGFTPTGKLHVGHFVGNLENLLKLKGEYDEFLLLADTHALTTLTADPKKIREYALDNLLDMLSVGLHEDEVSYYIESEIPEIYELAALFSMYVSHNRALRNPTIKDEITMKGLGDQFSLGFVNYPMYQAADIMCVKGELVPVGKDQEAHLEQAREITKVFNKLAGEEIFPEIKTLIGRVGKLIGTDGNPKMSKSLGNTIYLSSSEEEVEKKVMNMYTDPTRIHPTDPGHVEGNPVFMYLDAFGNDDHKGKIIEYKEAYVKGQVGDVEVKKYLVQVLNTFMDPIRERRKSYDNTERLLEIARKGTARAREETQHVLQQVKNVIGFIY